MKLLPIVIVLLVLGWQPAHAGVFEVVCVAPLDDNNGTCDSVISVPRVGPLWVHLSYRSVLRGGTSGHDSLTVAGGDTLTFVHWIPAGGYRYWLWASDASGEGCRTEGVTTVRGWPGMVRRVKP